MLPEWGRRRRAAVIAGPASVVALLIIALLAFGARDRAARDATRHTLDVVGAAQQTLTHAQDAETGQRGYLLTQKEAYLAPYDAGRLALGADLARLRALTADNTAQQQRLAALERALRAKLAELDTTVQLARRGEVAEAVTVVASDRGKVLMDSVRASLGAVVAAERTLLARREAIEARTQRATAIVAVVGGFLALVLAALTNRLLADAVARHARQAREIAAQADELVDANEQLSTQQMELETQAAQLQEQQVELEATNEHLQEQATELTAANEALSASEVRVQQLFAAEREARVAAEEANGAKSVFLSTMSHELRTPLNAIQGYTQLIELGIHGPVTAAQHEALARITRAQQHLLSLIDDILNLSRIEAGKLEYDVQSLSLAEVVAEVVPMIEPQLARKTITLTVQLDDRNDVPVWADRDRLRQVLLNLLGNAAKFTPAGGRITVALADRPGRADAIGLMVQDTGLGIPADRQAAIFEPFVQAHRDVRVHDALSQQGTGLGLTISRDLMRGMGGDIEVASAEGEGATFTLVLRRVHTLDGGAVERRAGGERRVEDERRSGDDRRDDDPALDRHRA